MSSGEYACYNSYDEMKHSLNLSQRVLDYIKRERLLPQGDTVLVGVSGGPDSVCLLHLLASLQTKLGIKLHVAHLNHGLRGAEADADANYVSNLAQSLKLPFTIESREVKALRSKGHLSLEEAARQVRYGFFSEMAKECGASRVAVGHTADDQVETILMNLVRGTGLRGLHGMAPLSQWLSQSRFPLCVVRPLLEISRQETIAYCQEQGLSPRLDISNYSPAFLRNRLRGLLPQLESLNPAMRKAFLRLSKAASEAVAFLDAEVGKAWPQVVAKEREKSLVLNIDQLRQLPAIMQRHLLLTAWERLRGDPQDLEAVHIEEMLAALARPVGTRLDLPYGFLFWVGYDHVGIGLKCDEIDNYPFPPLTGECLLSIPGETALPGWRVKASILSKNDANKQLLEGALTVYMDFKEAGDKLWVRSRLHGDRFQPLGMDGVKKLQDFMVDAKIPLDWRDRVPLVCSQQGMIWVVGYRLADGVKVTKQTEQVLRLEFKLWEESI